MYTNGSEEFNRLIETPNNNAIQKRLVFEDTGMVIDKFKTLIMYSSSNSQELQIGTTNMSYLDVEAYINIPLFDGQKLRLECGVELSDGSMEYAPMGVFTAVNTEKGMNSVKFTANDNMQKTEKLYTSSITYPTTSDKIIGEICEICEIELATPIENPITVTEKLQGYTCREALGFIAGIHGKFACFDRLGQLNLRWYSEIPIEKQNSLIWSFTKSQETFNVDKIEIAKDGETKFISGDGNNAIFHSNPLATQEITDNIFNELSGFEYSTGTIEMLDDIRLDIWDVIKINYLDGNTYFIPCMSIRQNMGASSTYIESFSKSITQNQYRYVGSTTQYLNRMATELLITNRVVAQKVDTTYVDAQVGKINTLIFGSASGNVISTQFSNSVIAQLGDAQIKSAMIQDVSASKISAGTIYTNDVTIQSQNGQMMLKDNTIQISDGTRARVQIGKDASDDYSINVWDKDGKLMFSQGGITDAAIKDAIIRNDMVSENANIHAGKLDISSLFTEINDNTTRSIKATKIYIDEKGQSLEFAFKQMTTTVDNITQTQTSQGTQLEIINGQISSKIWQQDITSAIDNVDIGGRNLLINTKEFNKTTTQNQTAIALDIGKFSDYYMATRESGKQITVSFDWETTATSGTLKLMFNNTPWNSIFYATAITISPTNKSGRIEYTTTLTDSTVDSTALYNGLRLRIDNVDGTTIIKNVKCEYGNKATDWTSAPEETEGEITTLTTKYSTLEQDVTGFKTTVAETYSTKTEMKSVQTVATQTANKFNWIVKSGTSSSDFTLTDRVASLLSEEFNIDALTTFKNSAQDGTSTVINGASVQTGTITADKIGIGDFTNLSVINPDGYNPNNYTIEQDDNGVKWFKFGSDETLGYYSVYMNYLSTETTFKQGDKYLFRGLIKASMETSVRVCLRVFYSDGGSPTYTNMASQYYDTVPTEEAYIQIPFEITTLPLQGRTIRNYGLFLETRNTKLGTLYVRELNVHQMADNVLIADGAITADKVDVADLFAQDIVATGSIISPLLKSDDYEYSSGDYSSAGMIVDLRNKIIQTPKFKLKDDGSVVAKDGTFSGKVTATSGEITGNLAFGSSGLITHTNGDYTVTLRSVSSNAGYGVFYITDRSSGTATYPFRLNGDGSVVASKATITGNINANEGAIGPITIQKGQGLYYNPTASSGFGLWATSEHDNIAFHAGANNSNIGGAPFRIYHDGSVVAGDLTAGNVNLTGGKIGNWSIQDGALAGTGSGTKMILYPNGVSYNVTSSTTDTFFLVVYNAGGTRPVGGLTNSGWKTIV